MSKITDLQRAVDNNARNCGTTAKKVRTLINASIQELTEKAINMALDEKSSLNAAQQTKFILDLIRLGVDVEKVVDAIKTQKALERLSDKTDDPKKAESAVILKMTAD